MCVCVCVRACVCVCVCVCVRERERERERERVCVCWGGGGEVGYVWTRIGMHVVYITVYIFLDVQWHGNCKSVND